MRLYPPVPPTFTSTPKTPTPTATTPCHGLTSDITFDQYILLDVYERYWFWPGWTEVADLMTREIPAGDNTEEVILEFTWPELETTETTGLRFWSAFLKPASISFLISTFWSLGHASGRPSPHL